MSANRICVSSSSIVAEVTTDSDNNHEFRIRDAERCFVRKDFQAALHLANQVLKESSPTTTTTTRSSHRVEILETPCLPSNSKLSVGFDYSITSADCAGAIVLQSVKEASLVDEAMLEPFLKFYATSPMPLELFVIFINFLLTWGEKQLDAIELATQVVHRLQNSPCTTNTTDEIHQVMDELVWTLVTKLIPFCPDERYLKNIFSNNNSAIEWQQHPAPAKRLKWRNEPIRAILPGLINALDSLHGVASKECLERCREQLSSLLGGGDDASDQYCGETRAMIPRQPRSRQSWISVLNRPGGYRKFAVRVFHLLTNRIINIINPQQQQQLQRRRSSYNHTKLEACRKAALTIFAIYVSWKQRRRIVTSLNFLANLCLKPIREILEAALEQ